MKRLLVPASIILILSCHNNTSKTNEKTKDSAATTTTEKPATPPVVQIPELTMPADSGKPYFKVAIYKNGQPFKSYEGNFSTALFSGDYFTLEMPASPRMLKISDFLVLYFKGITTGTFPIAPSGSEKGKPTLIFTPVIDGSYGVGIGATEGQVTITKYSGKSVTGTIDAKGKDTDGSEIIFKAAFMNAKNNDLEK
jgi:hypothetical protein